MSPSDEVITVYEFADKMRPFHNGPPSSPSKRPRIDSPYSSYIPETGRAQPRQGQHHELFRARQPAERGEAVQDRLAQIIHHARSLVHETRASCTFEDQLRLAVDLAAATGVAYFRSGLVEPPDLLPEFGRRGWEGIGFAHFKPHLIKVSRIDAADDHSAEEPVYSLQIIDVHSNEQRKRITEGNKLKLHLYRYFLSLLFGANFRLSPDYPRIRLSDTLASWIYTGCYTSECDLSSCVLNRPRLDPDADVLDAKPVPQAYLAVLNDFVDSQIEREMPYNEAWVEEILYEEFPGVEGWKRLSVQDEPEDNGDDGPDIGGEGPLSGDNKEEDAGQPLDAVDDDDDKKDLVRVKSEELTVNEAVNAVLPVTPTRQAPIKQETQEEVVDDPEQAVGLVTEEKKVVFVEEEHAARRGPCLRPRKRALS